NTNYVLAGLIAEKASGRSLKQLYKTRIFDPLYMRDSYFEPRVLPESVIARMSSGYFNNPVCGTYEPDCKVAPLQPLVGKDMRRADVSWTGAAGGIVSTPRDLQRWVRGLYAGRVLAPKQLKEMLTLVSSDTGKPIKETNADEPHGFGLGVAQVYGPGLGRVWFYEGMTLGYRVVHFYLPKDDIVVTVAANSQAPDGKDELPQLGIDLYEIIKGQETSAEGPKAPEDFD
ncbi:MAG TPA: serine hydrolase domain-containing protein, partial [Geminicoccus sp.]|uniref:serine hydrolase domain-containing protein n=1 Tax=Geminicoccus sp. TaxID=2024832 RepID=UPI002E2FB4D2